MKYFVYIVECCDGSLYTGSTTDVDRRVVEHNDTSSKGAKYTRARQPVKLVYSCKCGDRSTACKEEFRIKQLSRSQKLHLINSHFKG